MTFYANKAIFVRVHLKPHHGHYGNLDHLGYISSGHYWRSFFLLQEDGVIHHGIGQSETGKSET